MSSQHQQCLLCQSPELKPLRGYEHAHLVRCKKCGFVFAGAVPTMEELTAHYDNYPRNDYLSPITVKRYHELLDRCEPYRQHNRLLDTGCGIGLFLGVAKERGWEVHGTEFTDKAIELCAAQGITMHKGALDPGNYPRDFFDVVTSFEVIEHINNPLEDMANIGAILRSGGLLYVTTPNFNSLSRSVLKNKWNVIQYPEHLSYYVPRTMQALLKKSQFETLNIQTTGVSLSRMRTSLHVSDQCFNSATSDDEKVRVMVEKNRLLQFAKQLANGALTLSGRGDAMKVLARKI